VPELRDPRKLSGFRSTASVGYGPTTNIIDAISRQAESRIDPMVAMRVE
jgi:hypothetical protein